MKGPQEHAGSVKYTITVPHLIFVASKYAKMKSGDTGRAHIQSFWDHRPYEVSAPMWRIGANKGRFEVLGSEANKMFRFGITMRRS